MNAILALGLPVSEVLIDRLGWILIHSLWQFTLVALLAAVVLYSMPRHAAETRSVVLLGCLVWSVAFPITTWMLHSGTPTMAVSLSEVSQDNTGFEGPPLSDLAPEAQPGNPPSGYRTNGQAVPAVVQPTGSTIPLPAVTTLVGTPPRRTWMDRAAAIVRPWLRPAVGFWGLGVLLCSLRPLLGCLTLRRLKRVGVSSPSNEVLAALARALKRLGLRRRVQALESTVARVPLVIGYLQPMILLPASLLTNIPATQLEAILVHELAHVRRHDFIVNLLQILIETLFFYHPAVWWLSHRIRIEREHCCDDLVIRVMGNRAEYGRALIAIEEVRSRGSVLSLGASDGSLLERVRRISGQPTKRINRMPVAATGLIVGLICIVGIGVFGDRSVAAMNEGEWGPASSGLRCRLTTEPSVEGTFLVELENVSDRPLTLIGVRRDAGGRSKYDGQPQPGHFAPHLFEFEFADADGMPLRRADRQFFDAEHVLLGAIAEEIGPGESLVVKLRPADFHPPMDTEFDPGTYRAVIHYRGPSDETRAYFREHLRGQPRAGAWSGDVRSNEVAFTVSKETNAAPRRPLVWGKEQGGLQAAVEFRSFPGAPQAGVAAGTLPTKPQVATIFHVKNVSDQTVTFVSETGRQGDECTATDETGTEKRLQGAFYTGVPIMVRWTLKPGEIARLHALTSGVGQLWKPGKYTLRYGINFGNLVRDGGKGQTGFPKSSDYQQILYTGDTPITIQARRPKSEPIAACGEIVGTLLDAKTGEPMTGATVEGFAVLDGARRGDRATAVTDAEGRFRLIAPSPGIYNVWLKESRDSSMTAVADDGILVEAGKRSVAALRLVQRRRVVGSVVDANENPLQRVVVSCYSPDRPFGRGVESVRTDAEGRFVFSLPPGRAYLYVLHHNERLDKNPMVGALSADAHVFVPSNGKIPSVELTVDKSEPRIGRAQWARRTTPGTSLIRRELSPNITGRVVDPDGKQIGSARLIPSAGSQATTDAEGHFQIEAAQDARLVLHAFSPGYHLWTGTPIAGDVLEIVLEPKTLTLATEARAGAHPPVVAESAGPAAGPQVQEDQHAMLRTMREPTSLLPVHRGVVAVGFASADTELVTASAYHFLTIRSWDVERMQLKREIKLVSDRHNRPFRRGTVRLSADCRRVAVATDETVGIWDTATGQLLKSLPIPKIGVNDTVQRLDCTPDLSVIAAALSTGYLRTTLVYDSHVVVWNVDSGQVQTVTHKNATGIKAIALSADGKRLATTGGGAVVLWDASNAKLLHEIPNDQFGSKPTTPEASKKTRNLVWSLKFSPDSKRLAISGNLGLQLADVQSGESRVRIEAPYRYGHGVPGLVFSKDGRLVARMGTSAETERVVPIWSTQNGEKLYELHTESSDGAFSDDGTQLAIGFPDRQMGLAIWQLSGSSADTEQGDKPAAESTVNKVAYGTHYRGKKAAEFIDNWKPVWGNEQLGIQYSIALTTAHRQFRVGQRVPLAVFFRNVSDQPLQVDHRPDFFWNLPKAVHADGSDSNGQAVALERTALLGTIPHYRDLLQPGEALGPLYLNFGLGDNPRPRRQHWSPFYRSPVTGKYRLTHTVAFRVARPDASRDATSDDWIGGELTSGAIEFEIVDDGHP